MRFFGDLMKVLNQLIGKQNIFGYKTSTGNKLYLLYLQLGGVYVSDTAAIGNALKISYIAGMWSTFILPCFLIYPSFFSRTEPLIDKFYISFGPSIASYLLAGIPITLYFYKDNLEEFIRFIDSKLEKIKLRDISSPSSSMKKPVETRIFESGYFIRLTIVLLYVGIPFFDSLLFYDEQKIYTCKYFAGPIFFRHHVSPLQLFILEFFLIYVVNFLFFMAFTSFREIIDAFSTSVQTINVDFYEAIRKQSQILEERLERIQEEELRIEESDVESKHLAYSHAQSERDLVVDDFMKAIPDIVKEYQELIRLECAILVKVRIIIIFIAEFPPPTSFYLYRIGSLFKPFLEIHGSIMYLSFIAIEVVHAYFMFSVSIIDWKQKCNIPIFKMLRL